MKKLLIALISTFCMIGVYAEETLSYAIDPVATAHAPWEEGERIRDNYECTYDPGTYCYRIFLGALTDSRVLLQDFYVSGRKFTDPFIAVLNRAPRGFEINFKIEGKFISWYENGQKISEGNALNGRKEGFWMYWYRDEQRHSEGYYHNSASIGVWRFWDSEGNFLEEVDYGMPEN